MSRIRFIYWTENVLIKRSQSKVCRRFEILHWRSILFELNFYLEHRAQLLLGEAKDSIRDRKKGYKWFFYRFCSLRAERFYVCHGKSFLFLTNSLTFPRLLLKIRKGNKLTLYSLNHNTAKTEFIASIKFYRSALFLRSHCFIIKCILRINA